MTKKTFSFIFVFFTGLILLYRATALGQAVTPNIKISTSDSTIKINGSILKTYNLSAIEKIIGKPNRIKTKTFKSYYEEFGTKGMPPTSTPIEVTDYYYIYDSLGIMFYTQNGKFVSKEPQNLSIHFKNKRTFTNTAPLPFNPINTFSGVLIINGEIVNETKKIIPLEIDYRTEEFKLYKISFGPTSIATIIDGLYSIKSEPYMLIFLDSEKYQRISYIVIK